MADEKAVVTVTGDVTQVTAAFKEVEKKAKDTGKAVEGSFAKAAKSIQQNQMVSQLETISALFIQMGGNVSRVASVTTSLIRPVATVGAVLGTAGGAAAAAAGSFAVFAAAAGILVVATKSIVNGAVAARAELEALGHADAVTAAQRAELDAYVLSTQALTVALDRAKVAAGSGLASSLITLNGALLSVLDVSNKVASVVAEIDGVFTSTARGGGGAFSALLAEINERSEIFRRTAMALGSIGMSEGIRAISGYFSGIAEEAGRAAAATEELRKKMDDLSVYAQGQAALEDARRRASAEAGAAQIEAARRKALADQRAASEQAAREAQRNVEILRKAMLDDIENYLEAEREKTAIAEREAEARRKIMAKISAYQYDLSLSLQEYAAAEQEVGEAGVAALAQLEQSWDDYSGSMQQATDVLKETRDYWQPYADAAEEALGNVIGFLEMEAEADLDLYEQKKARMEDLYDRRTDLQQRLMDATTQEQRAAIAADIATTDVKLANTSILEDKYRKDALDAWKRNKALQIAQNFINQQAAFGMTMANSPIPFPGNMWAAGAAASAVATGLLEIAAAKPPEFPTGRSPDHAEVVAVQQGEPVLSRRATASLGGIDAVRALNEGRSTGGGSVTLEMSAELRRWFRTQRNPRMGKGVRR
mgnify:CR=1 FL=1